MCFLSAWKTPSMRCTLGAYGNQNQFLANCENSQLRNPQSVKSRISCHTKGKRKPIQSSALGTWHIFLNQRINHFMMTIHTLWHQNSIQIWRKKSSRRFVTSYLKQDTTLQRNKKVQWRRRNRMRGSSCAMFRPKRRNDWPQKISNNFIRTGWDSILSKVGRASFTVWLITVTIGNNRHAHALPSWRNTCVSILVGIAITNNAIKVPDIAKTDVLGSKRRRGRPKKVKGALLVD